MHRYDKLMVVDALGAERLASRSLGLFSRGFLTLAIHGVDLVASGCFLG